MLVSRVDVWFRQNLRRWLRQNPQAFKALKKARCFSADAEALSRGIAIGLFFGLTPTVGFQTALVLPSCLLLRANFPFAFAATWVSNPITMAPLYLAFNRIGEHFIGSSVLSMNTTENHPWLNLFAGESLQMGIGCLAFALPASLAGYLVTRYLGRQGLNAA